MDLAAILRCPRCRGTLDHSSPEAWDCTACALRYPERDGIPDFTPDDAIPLPPSGVQAPPAPSHTP